MDLKILADELVPAVKSVLEDLSRLKGFNLATLNQAKELLPVILKKVEVVGKVKDLTGAEKQELAVELVQEDADETAGEVAQRILVRHHGALGVRLHLPPAPAEEPLPASLADHTLEPGHDPEAMEDGLTPLRQALEAVDEDVELNLRSRMLANQE